MKKFSIRDVIIFVVLLVINLIFFNLTASNSLIDIFLLVQIPVFLAGFLLSPSKALVFGLILPLLSYYIFDYPETLPYTVILSMEFATYAFIASFLNKRHKINVFISQIVSMLVGRIVSGAVVFVLVTVSMLQIDPIKYVEQGFINAWPGIILQLIVVPFIMYIFNHYTTINLE